jgi:hypothetical protein
MSTENTEAVEESDDDVRDTGEMGIRKVLADRAGNDLSRDERETGIDFFSADDRFTVHSYEPTIVRALLRHDEAAIKWLFVEPDTGRGRRESNLREVADREAVEISGVKATLPTAVLKIKGKPRTTGRPSSIVSTPSDAESVEEEFQ